MLSDNVLVIQETIEKEALTESVNVLLSTMDRGLLAYNFLFFGIVSGLLLVFIFLYVVTCR